jgi:predicted porin
MDHTKRWAAGYLLKFSKNVRAFVQYGNATNTSNYDTHEIINRNYSENTGTFGISLLGF